MTTSEIIQSMQTNLSNAYDTIEERGGTLPQNKNLANLSTAIDSIPASGGGELNIAYGLTPPQDTSKLWVKRAAEPDFVEVSPDSRFNFGTMTETLGVGTADFTNFFFVDDLYLYSYYNNYVRKYNKETFELINSYSVAYGFTGRMCIVDNIMYYLASVSSGSSPDRYYNADLHAKNLDTNVDTTIATSVSHLSGQLLYYDGRIYIVGGYSYRQGSSYGSYYYAYTNTTSTYVYDIASGISRTFSSPSLMGDVSVCLIDSTVYVFGGYIPEHTGYVSGGGTQNVPAQYSNQIYAIDLLTETYTAKINMNNATHGVGVANIGRYIYIAGGYATPTSLFVFDTIENTITNTNIQLTGSRTSCGCYFIGTNLILSSIGTRVDKITVEVELQENVLRIFVETSNNLFNIINWQNATVRIGVSGVFVGNSNDLAESVDWATYDGTNWVNDDGTIDFTKLYPPTISISGATLTVVNDGRNSSYVTAYKIYNGQTLLTTTANTTVDLSSIISTAGAYNLTVVASGTGYTDSNASNAVEFSAYSITNVLTNVSAAVPTSTEQEALTTQSIIRYTYNGSTFNIVSPNDFTYNSPFYTREVTLHTAASSISITANGTTTQLTDSYQAVSTKNVTVTTDNNTDTFNITIRAKTTTAGSGKYFAMLQIGVRPLTMTSSGTTYKIIPIQDMGIISYVIPASIPPMLSTQSSIALTYTANSGYTLPQGSTSAELNVVGADFTWSQSTGVLTLSNPTGNITVTIVGEVAASGVQITVSVSGSGQGYWYDGQDNTGTLLSGSWDYYGGDYDVSITSGYVWAEGDNPGGYVAVGYFASEPTVDGNIVLQSWDSTYNGGAGGALFKINGAGTIYASFECLIEGTQITLADGSTKAIEDITYDDKLLVWDFYEGKLSTAKPKWIKVEGKCNWYSLVKFSNGSWLGSAGPKGHRIFDANNNCFTYTSETPTGTLTYDQHGYFPEVVSQEIIKGEVKYYNIITDKHFNLFANGILTSCRLSNKYKIENMKYVGEELISAEDEEKYFKKIERRKKQ